MSSSVSFEPVDLDSDGGPWMMLIHHDRILSVRQVQLDTRHVGRSDVLAALDVLAPSFDSALRLADAVRAAGGVKVWWSDHGGMLDLPVVSCVHAGQRVTVEVGQ